MANLNFQFEALTPEDLYGEDHSPIAKDGRIVFDLTRGTNADRAFVDGYEDSIDRMDARRVGGTDPETPLITAVKFLMQKGDI